MLDYKVCNKIINYLDKNKLDELRKYIEREKNNYYLHHARVALEKFLNGYSTRVRPFFRYVDEKLLLCNGAGIYLLNSDEILTNKYKNEKDNYFGDKKFSTKECLEVLEELSNRAYSDIDEVKIINDSKINLRGCDFKVSQDFNRKYYEQVELFLGEGIDYQLCAEVHALKANSPKGRALLLGQK